MKKEEIKIPAEILGLIDERENARKKKDWKLADKLREKIREKGFSIDDTSDSVKVSKI